MKTRFSSLLALFGGLCVAQAAESASGSLAALREYASGGDVAALRRYEQLVVQAVNDAAVRELVEADLVRALGNNSTFEAKRFACTQLAVIGTEASVTATAALLKTNETVGIACLALATNPSPKAGQALRNTLDKLKGQPLVQVINTLGTRRDPAAVRKLRELSGDAEPAVAGAAYLALGKVASPAAQTALAEARKKNDPSVASDVAAGSFIAAEHLLATNRRITAQRIYEELLEPGRADHVRRGAFEALVRLDRDGGGARVAEALAGAESLFKPSAIAAVAGMTNQAASKSFGAVLPRLEPGEQALMVESLTLRNDADARQVIQEQLESPYELVSTTAIQSLGRIGDASTVPVLGRAVLSAKNEGQLRIIESALAGLKGGDAVDQALIAQLRNRMAGPKAPFLGALVRRASPSSLNALLAESASADPAMAKLAFQGLSRVAKPGDLPAVLKALAGLRAMTVLEDAQASVGQILRRAESPSKASASVLQAYLYSSDSTAPERFMPLLAFCPDPEGLAQVVAAANASEPGRRDLGFRTLADWPDTAAWEPLLALYSKAPSATERVLALRGLARLLGEQNAHPDAAVVGRYRALLVGANNDADRKLILGALAGCNDPGALALAIEQLDQPGAVAEAKFAVTKIAEAIKAQHPDAVTAALKKLEGK